MDTDGHCGTSGQCEFSASDERLARQVHELVTGLGYKLSLRSKQARFNGQDHKVNWTVSFTAAERVFRLDRKAERQRGKVRPTTRHRYITAVRPVASVPVRCIQVDSPTPLYLASQSCMPTHNSSVIWSLIRGLESAVGSCFYGLDHPGRYDNRT